jgi:hypothetical protein
MPACPKKQLFLIVRLLNKAERRSDVPLFCLFMTRKANVDEPLLDNAGNTSLHLPNTFVHVDKSKVSNCELQRKHSICSSLRLLDEVLAS